MTEQEAAGRTYTGEEMRALLVAGGKYSGVLNVQAAVHLITFTDLPDWRGFRALVDIEPVYDRANKEHYTVALVRDWGLGEARAARLHGAAARLVRLAVSMATGTRVDLRENLVELGHAHARRVLEAVAIISRAAEFYTLTPTPELDRLLAFHAEMSGGAPS